MDDGLCDLPAAVISSSSTGKNDAVIGLDEDLIAIKGRLCGESSKLEVIPIVGMGGIGKTTLARNAYDDPLIVESFHIRVFVQVSQDYSAKELLSNILSSIKLEMSGEKTESEIAEKVYKSLKGRRYVIVMDDIWSTDAWDDVRNIFPDDDEGSRIILTTRDLNVAAYASPDSPLHHMKFMDEIQSWDLIKQRVFTNSQDCPPELEHIGKEIAGGCRGLPLAVVLVAGILSTIVKTRSSWEEIATNVNSVVEVELEKILSLSYTHLPHHLKPCFLFMAGFPEDDNIHVSRLIKLWVAEGFLKGQNGCKSLEEEAEEYLEDLVKRSLVLVTSRKSDGKIKSCSLHDLVRDMCIKKAHEEKFLLTDRYVPENIIDECRISIGHSDLNDIWGPTIHTILCFQTILDFSSLAFLVNFKLLRVLDVIHDNSTLLPLQVFELFHLRYLALGRPNRIPAAISKLENLETLIIRPYRRSGSYGSLASYLPQEIWSMPRLRHLVLTEYCMLCGPPARPTLPLENLQTLSGIPIFSCSERILKLIPNLKKLGIIYSTNEGHQDLLGLVNLRQLEKLKITAPDQRFSLHGLYLAFPSTLKKLSLDGGELPWKVMSIVGSLPNLQVLKLKNYACSGSIWETADGEFPELNFLLIEYSNLENWITESNPFPRLKRLLLAHCSNLTEIPDGIGDVPTLELIEVHKCNESLVKSAKQIQEDQQSYGNDDLQLHSEQVLPDVILKLERPEKLKRTKVIDEHRCREYRLLSEGLLDLTRDMSDLKLSWARKTMNTLPKDMSDLLVNLGQYQSTDEHLMALLKMTAARLSRIMCLIRARKILTTECSNEGVDFVNSELTSMKLNRKVIKRSNLARMRYQNWPRNSRR